MNFSRNICVFSISRCSFNEIFLYFISVSFYVLYVLFSSSGTKITHLFFYVFHFYHFLFNYLNIIAIFLFWLWFSQANSPCHTIFFVILFLLLIISTGSFQCNFFLSFSFYNSARSPYYFFSELFLGEGHGVGKRKRDQTVMCLCRKK